MGKLREKRCECSVSGVFLILRKWDSDLNFVKSCILTHSIGRQQFSFINHQLSLYLSHDARKTGLRGFRPGPTQTGLYSLSKKQES